MFHVLKSKNLQFFYLYSLKILVSAEVGRKAPNRGQGRLAGFRTND